MNDITIRLVLGAAMIAACAFAGKTVARSDQRRSRLLAETMDGMQLLKIHMLDNLLPMESALERSQAVVLRETGRCMEGKCAHEAWNDACSRETLRGGQLDCLTGADCEVLDRFFMQLGNSSREEQRRVFDSAIREIGTLEDSSRSKGEQKSRLYTALGALTGAAVVVAML